MNNVHKQLKILVWAINESRTAMEEMCANLIASAAVFGVEIELLGIGRKHTEHKERIWILHEYLQTIPVDTIIVCMDGADTLFNDSTAALLEQFYAFNTRILISAEKDFTYQYPSFKAQYDRLPSAYRYINAGTFMGYAGDLLAMFTEIIELNEKFPNANDQGLIGIWATLYLHQPQIVQLDLQCAIFWVTTHDWNTLKQVAQSNEHIYNPNTGNRPVIIHNVGNAHPPHRAAYDAAFATITKAKEEVSILIRLPSGQEEHYPCNLSKIKADLEAKQHIAMAHQLYVQDGQVVQQSADLDEKQLLHVAFIVNKQYLVCDQSIEALAYDLGYTPLVPPSSAVEHRTLSRERKIPHIKPTFRSFYKDREELEVETKQAVAPFYDAFNQHRKERLATIGQLLKSLKEGVVVVSTFNKPFVELFLNFLAACEKHHIAVKEQVLFFPMDEAACEACAKVGVKYYYNRGAYGRMPSTSSGFGHGGFRNFMFMKNAIVQDVLELGYDVLFMDIDMVWLRNPTSYLKRIADLGSYDFLFMYDGPNFRDRPLHYNTGFVYIRNTTLARQVWKVIFDNYDKIWVYRGQQGLVNQIMNHFEAQGLRNRVLNELQFVNGHLLTPRFKDFKAIPDDAYVVHVSWTADLNAKRNRYKEYGLWYLD
ncbi:MAG: putative nucleotide-diphospho-sugar transferase [Bacteroidota bacterium]